MVLKALIHNILDLSELILQWPHNQFVRNLLEAYIIGQSVQSIQNCLLGLKSYLNMTLIKDKYYQIFSLNDLLHRLINQRTIRF